MSKNSNNWCPDIYHNLFIDRHNHDAIRIAPCCQAKTSIEPIDTFNFNTNVYLNKLREQFKNNERPAECNACWQAEDVGHTSRRQFQIKHIEKFDYTTKLTGIDHSATWACNLACIMCGPGNSSTWAKELSLSKDALFKLGRQFQKENNFIDSIDLSNITRVYFNGGEPLLNNEHLNLLELLDNRGLLKNVKLSYNSNGTISPSARVRELWNKAQHVVLLFSIDATNQAFNYIRYPGEWSIVSNNIKELKKSVSNLRIGINTTVGNYNVLEVSNVWNWFAEISPDNTSDFNWQFVNKEMYDLNHLPLTIKNKAIEKLAGIEKFSGIVNYFNLTDNTPSTMWISELNRIDARRGTNWRAALEIGKYY